MATELWRWEPFRELATLRDEMERIFRQIRPGSFEEEGLAGGWRPHLDLEERDDAFVLYTEMSGVKPEDIEVTFDEGVLTIEGERRFYEDKKAEGFHRVERRFGRFHRAVRLPGRADPDKIEAAYKDGMLTVTIRKSEEAKAHSIPITSE